MGKKQSSESYLDSEDYFKLAKQKELISLMHQATRQSYRSLISEEV